MSDEKCMVKSKWHYFISRTGPNMLKYYKYNLNIDELVLVKLHAICNRHCWRNGRIASDNLYKNNWKLIFIKHQIFVNYLVYFVGNN